MGPGLRRRASGIVIPALIALFLALTALTAQAGDRLPMPRGPVLLAISGEIDRTSDGKEALFDRQMLESLGLVTVAAISPLDDEPVEFQGVLLRRLLAAVGAHGNAVDAVALNDYVAEIPVSDAERHDVVIALSRQGHSIPVREMGPLMILYPMERGAGLETEAIQARSVRQLARLVIHNGNVVPERNAVAIGELTIPNGGTRIQP